MNKVVTLAAVATVLGSVAFSAAVRADCASDLAAAKESLAGISDAKKKKAVERQIVSAEKELSKKNEKRCMSAMKRVQKAMK